MNVRSALKVPQGNSSATLYFYKIVCCVKGERDCSTTLVKQGRVQDEPTVRDNDE